MIAAPTAAKLITSAMICRCFDSRSSSNASRALTPFSLFTADDGVGLDALAPDDHDHEHGAECHQRGARQDQVDRTNSRRVRRQRRTGDAAERSASADEPEQPLGLARVVDDVGKRPELTDQQDTEDQPGDVERDRHPRRVGLKQEPEDDQHHRHPGLGDREPPPAGEPRHQPRIAGHEHADDQPGAEQHVRQVVGPEVRDELRSRERLDGVVRGHRQARVGEHEEGREALLFPDFDNRRQETLQHSREPKTCVS